MSKFVRLLIESVKVSFIVSFFIVLINVFSGFSLRFSLYGVMFAIIASIYFLTSMFKDIAVYIFSRNNTQNNSSKKVNNKRNKNYKNVS